MNPAPDHHPEDPAATAVHHRSRGGRLTCALFEERIHEVLDQRLSPGQDPELLRHAKGCPDCSQLLTEYDSVNDSMKLLRGQLEGLVQPAKPRKATWWRPVGLVLSTAAAVLLVLGLSGMLKMPGSGDNPGATVVIAPASPDAGDSRSSSVESIGLEEADPPLRLWPEPSSLLSYLPSWRSPDWDLPRADEVQERINDLPAVLQWSNEIPGVRPFRGTLSVTLELLRRTLWGTPQDGDPNLGQWDAWPLFVGI